MVKNEFINFLFFNLEKILKDNKNRINKRKENSENIRFYY